MIGKNKVIVLIGVSGSGKTTIGRLLSGGKYYEEDDFHPPANIEKLKNGVPLDDADRKPWLESLRDLIRNCLERGDSAVVACSALKQRYREGANTHRFERNRRAISSSPNGLLFLTRKLSCSSRAKSRFR